MATRAIHLRQPHVATAWAGPQWRSAFHFATEHYLLLPIGALVALFWANAWPDTYFRFAQTVAYPVNEIAMVLFFGLVAQEIFEEIMPGGALHRWRRWIVPIVAAVGGVAGSAGVYGAFVSWKIEPLLHAGWPAVIGVDLVFAYFITRAIFHRHPAVPFVMLLAVVSNAVAFLAIAPRFVFGGSLAGGAAALMALAIGLSAWLRRQQVQQFWPYIWGCGGLSWMALYLDGFHPALALVPIVPFMPHARRRLDSLFADEGDVRAATPRHFEHVWHYHVQVALLLFGLVNAGVVLSGYGTGTWATLFGSLIGRTAGILAATALAAWIGLHFPVGVRWRELTVIALAASGGFTFTLFFATTLYPSGPLLGELKLGALTTVTGVLLALAAARLLHVGRFARRHRPRADLVAHRSEA
jgi:NhaA family Na+:H+ antiporter